MQLVRIQTGITLLLVRGRSAAIVRDKLHLTLSNLSHRLANISTPMSAGGGKFQSKKAMEARKKNNEGLRSLAGPGQTDQETKMSEALEKVAKEHGIESVTAIALAYVMAKAPYVFPIVGGRKVEHLMDNLQALKIKLTSEQIEYLESIVPFAPGFPNSFVSDLEPKRA